MHGSPPQTLPLQTVLGARFQKLANVLPVSLLSAELALPHQSALATVADHSALEVLPDQLSMSMPEFPSTALWNVIYVPHLWAW